MLQLRQLDLQLAFGALRALREDVEDEAHAIDDAAVQRALEVALLCPREGMIEDDKIGAALGAPRRDLRDLAAAGEQSCVGPVAAGGDDIGDFCAGRTGERLELGHALSRLALAEVELDQ
jgi:hypothetical protein